MEFAPHMPVAAIARILGEHDRRIWRVLEHDVRVARAGMDFSALTRMGVDETSARPGQDYASVLEDLDERRAVFVTQGRDAATVERFAADLAAHGGTPEQVTSVCADMSPAFICGIAKHLPQAEVTFDRYHVIQHYNSAVDEVRRCERKTRPELARSTYVWLKRPDDLTERGDGDADVACSAVVTAGHCPGLVVAVGLRRLLQPAAGVGRGVLDALVPRCDPFAAGAGEQVRAYGPKALGRDPAVAPCTGE